MLHRLNGGAEDLWVQGHEQRLEETRRSLDPWHLGSQAKNMGKPNGKKSQFHAWQRRQRQCQKKKEKNVKGAPGGSYPLHQLRESIFKKRANQVPRCPSDKSATAFLVCFILLPLYGTQLKWIEPAISWRLVWRVRIGTSRIESHLNLPATWCPQKLHAVRAPQRWLTSLRFIRCRLLSQSAAWRCSVMQPWSATRVSECRGVCHIARVQGPQWLGP